MILHRHFETLNVEPPQQEDTMVKVEYRNRPKIAVYVATRNMYADMVTASKSLLCHSDVDKIYFLCEDDVFPLEIPREIETINVSGQKYFPAWGPNTTTHWTYMSLLRAVFDKIFPQYGLILSIDNDTAVVDDVSSLWDLDMTDYYFAGVPEPNMHRENSFYINGGVMMVNLDLLRANEIGNKMQKALNTRRYEFVSQDTIDMFCAGHILEIPVRFNESPFTGRTNHPAIVHYAGVKKFDHGMNAERADIYQRYREMNWKEVAKCRKARYGKELRI